MFRAADIAKDITKADIAAPILLAVTRMYSVC
jgi:hypothetical protein